MSAQQQRERDIESIVRAHETSPGDEPDTFGKLLALIAAAREEGARGDSWRAGVQEAARLAAICAGSLRVDLIGRALKRFAVQLEALAAGPAPLSYEQGLAQGRAEMASEAARHLREQAAIIARSDNPYRPDDFVQAKADDYESAADDLDSLAATSAPPRDAGKVECEQPCIASVSMCGCPRCAPPPRDAATDQARGEARPNVPDLGIDNTCDMCGGTELSTRAICVACEPARSEGERTCSAVDTRGRGCVREGGHAGTHCVLVDTKTEHDQGYCQWGEQVVVAADAAAARKPGGAE